jgi:hypothetical protein
MRFKSENLIRIEINAIFNRIRYIMTKEYEGRAFVTTHLTLKRITIIGIAIGVCGWIIYFFFTPFIGSLIFFLGFMITAICTISLLFLWVTDYLLPHPE